MKKFIIYLAYFLSVIVGLFGVSVIIDGNFWAGIPITVLGFISASLCASVQ